MKFPELSKGDRVKITKDVRSGSPATGQEAKFDRFSEKEGWLLFLRDGAVEKESFVLPDGYSKWDPEKEGFPNVKCGLRCRDPIFVLDDGSEIRGSQCYWQAVDKRLQTRFMRYEAYLKKLL